MLIMTIHNSETIVLCLSKSNQIEQSNNLKIYIFKNIFFIIIKKINYYFLNEILTSDLIQISRESIYHYNFNFLKVQ